MDEAMRRSGIDVIGDIPWGTHFCQFYETGQDLIDILVPYFREGLAANEFCMWVTSEPLKVDQAIVALKDAVPDLDEYLDSGQIEILDYSEWYTRSGKFSADEVLQGWVDKLTAAQRLGYQGLRLTGNTFWLEKADWDDFTRYEETVNNVIGRYPMLAICTYSLQKCNAIEILDVVANHQFALIKRSNQWGIIESSHHKKMEQALRLSEERYSTTLSSIGDAVIAADAEGNITFMNAVAEELTGWTLREALQKPSEAVFNIINEHTLMKAEDPVAKVLDKGAIVGLANHTLLVKKDGTEVPIDDSGAPIKDRKGNTIGAVLVFRDITERRQRENELSRLASFPRLNPNPIAEVDTVGQVSFLNSAAQQLFPDLQGNGRDHPWLANWDAVVRMFRENERRSHVRNILAGGRWYQQAMYALPGGQHIRIYGLDITDRKRAEEALQKANDELENRIREGTSDLEKANRALGESEERFRVALKNSPILIYNQDRDLRYTWAYNPQQGFTVDGCLGKTDLDVGIPQAACLMEIKQSVLDTGKGARKEVEVTGNDGLTEIYDLTVEPLIDPSGKVSGVTCSAIRITEMRQMIRDLREARDAAEAASRAKAAFMANMSHELRTPMNYIIGMTSLLLDEPLTPELREYVETIRQGGDEMMALINDILDFSRLEKKNVALELQPMSLRALVEESMDMVASAAGKRALNLTSTVKYGTPDAILGDHGRLRQVLVNLLENAVKFTDCGEVSISLSSKPLGGNKHQIKFSVKDTGIGIPPESLGELFLPFSQVETDLSQQRNGAGLGLATSKRLIELMGGEIWAESGAGCGSTFCFTVEAEGAPDNALEPDKTIEFIPDAQRDVRSLAILVAEDVPSNQKVLLEMLKRMGYRADAVADGREVLQALQVRPYDLVFMDLKMPKMSGIEATREIRRLWPEDGPRIIAITAYALEGDKERCLEVGMDGYIAKPIKIDDLAALLDNITSA